MDHSKRLVSGSHLDVLTTQAGSYFVGVQMSKVLQRETFNLYRSFKLKKIPFLRASTPEIEFLIEVGAVPGSTHSITLVPVDLAVPYIEEVLKQQETGKGLTGRKPKRLREQHANNMKREESEESLHDDQKSPKRIRREEDCSSSSPPSSPSRMTTAYPDSPSPPFSSSFSSTSTLSSFSSTSPTTSGLFVPSFPLVALEVTSSPALLLRGGTQPQITTKNTQASDSPQSLSPPSSPTLLSLLSVGMEIDKARTRRRKPAPEAIYRSLKKDSVQPVDQFRPLSDPLQGIVSTRATVFNRPSVSVRIRAY